MLQLANAHACQCSNLQMCRVTDAPTCKSPNFPMCFQVSLNIFTEPSSLISCACYNNVVPADQLLDYRNLEVVPADQLLDYRNLETNLNVYTPGHIESTAAQVVAQCATRSMQAGSMLIGSVT